MTQQNPVKSEQTLEKYIYMLFPYALAWFGASELIGAKNYGTVISALGFLTLGITFAVNRNLMNSSWRVKGQPSPRMALFWLLCIASALLLMVAGVIVEFVAGH